MLGEGLEKFGLTAEAAEDPNILISRIERVAQMVQKTLQRPSEHPLVHFSDEDSAADFGGRLTPEEEARWDASFKENRRRQERVQRAIEKHLSQGESIDEAFDAPMRGDGPGLAADESEEDDAEGEDGAKAYEETEDDSIDEDWSSDADGETDDEADPFDITARERHPLLERASDLLMRLHELFKNEPHTRSGIGTLTQGTLEISGGLAQALSFEDDDDFARGLAVVQLNGALRGAAFAIGALFPLRHDGLIGQGPFKELHATLEGLQSEIYRRVPRAEGG